MTGWLLILNCSWRNENDLRHSSSNYYPRAVSALNMLGNHNSNCMPKGLLILSMFTRISTDIHTSVRDKCCKLEHHKERI
jgi:hypothetical protein